MNRREFLQIMAAAYLVGLNQNVFGKSSVNYNYSFNSDIRLLHITDTHAQLNPSYFSYSVSKFGLWGVTQMMAQEYSPTIRVNAIAPGPFPSMMLGSAVNHDYSGIAVRNPRKRVGTPEDIAGLAIFLCSRAGSYTIGETITCDGGLVNASGHDLS